MSDDGDDETTRELIRRAEVAAMVLLKNDGGLLPLGLTTQRLALIGPNAAEGKAQGGGSAQVTPERVVGPLDALRRRGYDVTFEPGGYIGKTLPVLEADGRVPSRADRRLRPFDHNHRATAEVALAAAAGRRRWATTRRVRLRWAGAAADSSPTRAAAGRSACCRSARRRCASTATSWSRFRLARRAASSSASPLRSGGPRSSSRLAARTTSSSTTPWRRARSSAASPSAPATSRRAIRSSGRLEAAAGADAAVVIVGTDEYFETEGEDRSTLALPGEQDALVAAVAAANPNTVVVLNSGSPVTMPWLDDVAAVVQLWFPGQELGDALADVLSGDQEPGGRLPVTFPRTLDETPAAPYYPPVDGRSVYGERQLIGYRWFDRTGVEPLFPFGHGLGYTTFTIAPVDVTGSPGDGVTVTVDVANTGERSGGEVVQVYVEPVDGDPLRPVRQLAGFRRVRVDHGATERVEIELSPRAFEVWRDGGWVRAAQSFRLLVGRSSRDLTEAGTVDG